MVDTQYLENRIDSAGIKKGTICEKMGISRTAFWKKINNKIPFRCSEVYVLCDLLRIPEDKKESVFFFTEDVNKVVDTE